ncbi:MAG: MauE/DoxX family redox-associated membrane protein [Thermodesulfobacteriota bacterium]|nr:MauE/DoxX family redox-associated membrane protein [Thermodesulfobacteriota bacterium]
MKHDKLKNMAPLSMLVPRLVLGGLFVYASIHKIAYPGEFVDILRGYNLFPAATLHPIAVFVPWLELVCGAALVFGIFPRGAAAMINLMLLVFITAISINLLRGHEFDCGCFSFSHNPTTSVVHLLIRDIISLAMGLYLLFFIGSGSRMSKNMEQ